MIINIGVQSAINFQDPNGLIQLKFDPKGEKIRATLPASKVSEIENRIFNFLAIDGRVEVETMRDVNSGWVTLRVFGGSSRNIVKSVLDHLSTWEASVTEFPVQASDIQHKGIFPRSEQAFRIDADTGYLGCLYLSWNYNVAGEDIATLEASTWPLNKATRH